MDNLPEVLSEMQSGPLHLMMNANRSRDPGQNICKYVRSPVKGKAL